MYKFFHIFKALFYAIFSLVDPDPQHCLHLSTFSTYCYLLPHPPDNPPTPHLEVCRVMHVGEDEALEAGLHGEAGAEHLLADLLQLGQLVLVGCLQQPGGPRVQILYLTSVDIPATPKNYSYTMPADKPSTGT